MQETDKAAAFVTPQEMRKMSAWAGEMLLTGSAPPFSFSYDGRTSGELLDRWQRTLVTEEVADHRRQTTQTWRDDGTGLQVRCVAVMYNDFPVVEWTVYFENTGIAETPILADVQGLDVRFERGAARPAAPDAPGEFVLHHWRGDFCTPDSYQPFEQLLWHNTSQTFAPVGGRGSNSAFPYYNLQMPAEEASAAGAGLILAVGWPGQWSTTFARDAGRGLQIRAGQEVTYLRLRPGEAIRTPLIVLLFWEAPSIDQPGDDLIRAQNLWRRWMWAHNVPRTADGALWPAMLFGNTSGEFNEMIDANEQNQKYFVDRYKAERIAIDYWWMDAGWYPCQGQWPMTGTWEPDTVRFPGGLRAISDHARAKGIKTLVWFEPERVAPGTWLWQQHPEWLIPEASSASSWTWARRSRLLNLGLPEARCWLTDHVDHLLREQGIDLYRQDFNFDPLPFWRANDARLSPIEGDRQGISENLHIQGYLAFWDELRRRHPGMILDSCASGGRRNDLETLRRAVPLHPTDYNYSHLAVKQAFHSTMFQWMPYFGSNTVPVETVDTYAIRSGHGPALGLGYDLRRDDLDYELLRKLIQEWRHIAPYYYGDFYPLTPYSWDESGWLAWQFNRPEQGDGLIEAFRRQECGEAICTLRLHGLDPVVQYEITDLDRPGETCSLTGKQLSEDGLPVRIAGQPGAAAVIYRRSEVG